MAAKKSKIETSSLSGALDCAYSVVEELNDELQSWFDNLPENLQGGNKGDMLQEATGVLSCIDQVDLPDCVASDDATGDVNYQGLPRKPSRSDRCQYAIGALQAVADELRTRVEALDDDTTLSDEEKEDRRSAMESAADDLENQVSELEGVEFPGMFS